MRGTLVCAVNEVGAGLEALEIAAELSDRLGLRLVLLLVVEPEADPAAAADSGHPDCYSRAWPPSKAWRRELSFVWPQGTRLSSWDGSLLRRRRTWLSSVQRDAAGRAAASSARWPTSSPVRRRCRS